MSEIKYEGKAEWFFSDKIYVHVNLIDQYGVR